MRFLCFLLLPLIFLASSLVAQSNEEIKLELKNYARQLNEEQRSEFFAKLKALTPEQRKAFLERFYKKVTQHKKEQDQGLLDSWQEIPKNERRGMVRDFGKIFIAPSGGEFMEGLLESIPQEYLEDLENFISDISENPDVQKIVETIVDFSQMSDEEKRAFAEDILADLSEKLEEGLEDSIESLDKEIFKTAILSKKIITKQKEYTRNLKHFWNLPESTQKELLKLSAKERWDAIQKLRKEAKNTSTSETSSALVIKHGGNEGWTRGSQGGCSASGCKTEGRRGWGRRGQGRRGFGRKSQSGCSASGCKGKSRGGWGRRGHGRRGFGRKSQGCPALGRKSHGRRGIWS